MNSRPPASRSHRSATEKSRASSTAKPPGVFPSASPSIEIVTMSPGMQCTVCGALNPSFSLTSSPSITFLIRGARGSEMSTICSREDRIPGTIIVSRSQLRMARRRTRIPAEMMQLIADIRHLRPMHDLPKARRARIHINHRDEIRPIDPRPLIQTSHIHKLLRRLLASHRRRRVTRPGVLVILVCVRAHGRLLLFGQCLTTAA